MHIIILATIFIGVWIYVAQIIQTPEHEGLIASLSTLSPSSGNPESQSDTPRILTESERYYLLHEARMKSMRNVELKPFNPGPKETAATHE